MQIPDWFASAVEPMSNRPRLNLFSLLASLAAVTAIRYWRKPDAFLNPQFWAEDGKVFFQHMYEQGLSSIWAPYSGYYHLVPRLVAWFAEALPYRFAPAVYNYAGLLGMWAVVGLLHSPRLRLPYPFLFALPLVLVPHFTGVVFLNLTNVQWPLALLLLLTVLQEPPKRTLDWVVDVAVLVLVGLSTPLIVLALPILAIRTLLLRSLPLVAETGLALIVAGLQVLAFRSQPTFVPPQPEHSSTAWLELLGWKTIGNFFLGWKLPYELSPLLLLIAGSVFFAFLIWRLARMDGLGWGFALPSMAFAVMTTAMAFYKFRDAANLLVPPAAAARYFYVLWVVISWGLLLLVLRDKPRWSQILAALSLSAILWSSLNTEFRRPPFPNLQWASYEEALEAREPLEIPINPQPWKVKLNQ